MNRFVSVGVLVFCFVVILLVFNMGAFNKLEVIKEIESIVRQKAQTQQNVAEISENLQLAIEKDPYFVAVALVVTEAGYWPRLQPEDQERIMALAVRDSESALKDLEKCLSDEVTKEVLLFGRDPDCGRHFWYNNNKSTSILFVGLPVAKRLGLVQKFLTYELEGYRQGRGQWYENKLSSNQYIAWYCGGNWPWPQD